MAYNSDISDSEAENIRPRLSLWFYTDIAICLVIPFFGIFLMTLFSYSYVIKAMMLSLIVLTIIFICKKRYYSDPSETQSHKHKLAAAAIRTVIYTAVIFAAVLPFTMNADVKWYYPVQKAVYFSNYKNTEPEFMPSSIPDNADNYNVSFVPPVLQANGMVMMCFRTDNETLDGLRQYAAKNGTRTVSDEKRLSIPRNYNIEVHDSCEVYVLPKYGGYSPIYYICPESGYFVLYW